MTQRLILTCEHASNAFPTALLTHIPPSEYARLHTHEGIDLGAAAIMQALVNALHPYHHQTAKMSRLLIDCNRSLTHPTCFSSWTHTFTPQIQQDIIETYYLPFRNPVIECIKQCIQHHETILHCSIHTFTPVFNGQHRTTDVGLLYHPHHTLEKESAQALKRCLKSHDPNMLIHMNQPYQGRQDGFTQTLRQNFSPHYIGLEIEVNQRYLPNLTTLITKILIPSFKAWIFKT